MARLVCPFVFAIALYRTLFHPHPCFVILKRRIPQRERDREVKRKCISFYTVTGKKQTTTRVIKGAASVFCARKKKTNKQTNKRSSNVGSRGQFPTVGCKKQNRCDGGGIGFRRFCILRVVMRGRKLRVREFALEFVDRALHVSCTPTHIHLYSPTFFLSFYLSLSLMRALN